MKTRIDSQAVVFEHDGVEAGRYVLDDPFKPYVHPLLTPKGHRVSDCMPSDHRHHKGLMFALRCEDLNFWEEDPDGAECGVQISRAISPMEADGATGFRQDLRWQAKDGGRATYDEIREVLCRHDGAQGFHWTWRSRRTALRRHRLVKSPWSLSLPDGRSINYHGLGIRLPWMWAFSGDAFNGVEIQGGAREWMQACGTSGPEMTWWGCIDGHWRPPTASVTFRQEQSDTWFVLKADFSYLSIGPSNANEVDVAPDQVFEETYHIIVQDR